MTRKEGTMTEASVGQPRASLASAIEAAKFQQGPRCTVTLALRVMKPEDATDLREAMERKDLPASAISRALRDWTDRDGQPLDIGSHAIQRHRRGECACPLD
jgi:hypothetical protein